MKSHIVKSGDTLSAIALKYDTTVGALVASNGIKNKDLIYPGQVVKIPDQKETPTNTQLYNAFITCLDAIEDLPEFKQLEALLYGK